MRIFDQKNRSMSKQFSKLSLLKNLLLFLFLFSFFSDIQRLTNRHYIKMREAIGQPIEIKNLASNIPGITGNVRTMGIPFSANYR